MATKQNTTVAARLSDELFSRFNACIAAEVAARTRVDKLDEYGQGTALREAVLAWVEAMESSRRDPRFSRCAPSPLNCKKEVCEIVSFCSCAHEITSHCGARQRGNPETPAATGPTENQNPHTMNLITPELESAYTELKARCEATELFSPTLRECYSTEIAFIYAIKGGRYEQADAIATVIPCPEPLRTLSTHQECCLSIFEDGSLFDSNNAQSEVWADAYDFLADRLDRDNLTLGQRKFFQITEPADDAATDFVVNIRRFFHNVSTSDHLACEEQSGAVIRFTTRSEAQAWIEENEPAHDELYRCAHNEYARPEYTVIGCD